MLTFLDGFFTVRVLKTHVAAVKKPGSAPVAVKNPVAPVKKSPAPVKKSPAPVKKPAGVESFPLIVETDSVRAKIYRSQTTKGSTTYFTYFVAHKQDGQRKLKGFADLDAARAEAKRIVGDIASGAASALHISGDDRLAYVRAVETLRPFNVKVDAVAGQWAEARQLLNGVGTLTDACREYSRRHGSGIERIMVAEAVEKMLALEQQEHASSGRKLPWIMSLRSKLQNKFAPAFATYVTSVESKDLAQWLAGLQCGERTKKNMRDALDSFFRWCRGHGYLAKDSDPLEGVQDYRKRKRVEISILTPEQLSRLLSAAGDEFIPYLALRAFAGLRDAEASRLDWRNVDLEDGWIDIGDTVAKNSDNDEGNRRLVPISPCLRAWVEPHAKKSGPVCAVGNTANAIVDLCAAAGVEWERNCLRHSYISYAIAESNDIPRVAVESGNSPAIIRKHYLHVVKPAQAKEWFSILPSTAANVVSLHQKAA